MKNPLITIAIPTYNNERTIRKAIDSCLSQKDLEDCEILVVNNASKDSTGEILSSYGERIRVVTNGETVSLFENHNVALKQSLGRYIIFCHSDDVLYSDAISILKRRLVQLDYPERFICWGHSHFRDFSTAITRCGISTGQVFAGQYAINPFLHGGLTPSGTCYSKSFFEIGGFLPVQHRLAPSDASSMIYAALNGFSFEMMQAILFKRTDASTLMTSTGLHDSLDGYANAFDNLIEKIGYKKTAELIQGSYLSASPPLSFYQVTSKKFPRLVLKRMLKTVVFNPVLLSKKQTFRIFISCLIRIIHA
jgi:glycosyltransferase involved in cell wall biosynthesis